MESNYPLTVEDILARQATPGRQVATIDDYDEKLNEYFVNGFPKGQPCGISVLDQIFTWRPGFVYCFTGYPGSGKSEILAWLAVLRMQKTNEICVMYSPESDRHELADQLCRLFLNQNTNPNFSNQCSAQDYTTAKGWVKDHFWFLNYDIMPTTQTLLDDYQELADKGASMFITDPFNYVAEGSMDDGNGISRYLKTALSHMKTFAKSNNVINAIVEHPKQPKPNQDGTIPRVSQFMINGGAMWNNKMDCIVGMTSDFDSQTAIFETLKMKSQRYNGQPGERTLNYDFMTGRFYA